MPATRGIHVSLAAVRSLGVMSGLVPHPVSEVSTGIARAAGWLVAGRGPIRTGYPLSLAALHPNLSVLVRCLEAERYIGYPGSEALQTGDHVLSTITSQEHNRRAALSPSLPVCSVVP